jgi:hypothetical protein
MGSVGIAFSSVGRASSTELLVSMTGAQAAAAATNNGMIQRIPKGEWYKRFVIPAKTVQEVCQINNQI